MQRLLDDRHPLSRSLREHARGCQSCRVHWEMWQALQTHWVHPPQSSMTSSVETSVATSVESSVPRSLGPTSTRRFVGIVATAAAFLLFGFGWSLRPGQNEDVASVRESGAESDPLNGGSNAATDLVGWTPPTLAVAEISTRVRRGVEPLGRSIRQAVCLLTVGTDREPTLSIEVHPSIAPRPGWMPTTGLRSSGTPRLGMSVLSC